jgi:ketosteroid isomerase-like protein
MPAGKEVAEGPEPEEGVLSSEDEAALKKFLDEIRQFVLASDWEALSQQYTEDAMFLPPNAPVFQGRESFLQMFAGVKITEHSHNLVEVLGVCGDRIFGRGVFAWTMNVEDSPEPISQSGKWVVELQRQLDGKFQIALHIWNLNPPQSE